jgi:hypothetical protein
MSWDASVKEKLIIDAVVKFDNRKGEYSKAFNRDSTPAPLACRSNVKYHVRERRVGGLRLSLPLRVLIVLRAARTAV